jgi:hypothetical protein
MSGHDFHGVGRTMMREFLGRLKHPAHKDYDTIRAIEEALEDAYYLEDQATDAQTELRELYDLCEEAGLIEPGDDQPKIEPLLRMFLPVD